MVDADPLVRHIVDHDVLETLVRVSEDGIHIEPELATHFEISADGRRYTFYLSEDARWHDGVPVSSFDVDYIFSKIADSSGTVAPTLFLNITEVLTPDDRTVVISLDHAAPDFLFALSTIPILPEHIFGRTPLALHAAARAPIGSGPFRFVRWEPSRLIELERNPDWRGKPPKVERLIYWIVPDDRVAADMFRHGDLDVVPGLSASRHVAVPGGRLITAPQPYLEAWVYNIENFLFKDSTVRQAIGSLIDRKTIRRSILGCRADLVSDPWLTSENGLSESPFLPFDPEGAQQKLTDAGWRDRDGDGFRDKYNVDLRFSLLLPDLSRDMERTAIIVQQDLFDAGIDMEIIKVSRGAFINRLREGRFDVAGLSILARPRFDSWSLLHSRAVDGLDNFGAYRDGEMDALLDALQAEQERSGRLVLQNKISRRIRMRQPLSFVFRPYETIVVRDGLINNLVREGWIEARRLSGRGDDL